MKVTDPTTSMHARTSLFLGAPACMLVLVLTHIACLDEAKPPYEAVIGGAQSPVLLLSTAGPASQPADPSSVMVYIKMVVERKYGILAHVVGKRDTSVRDPEYNPNKSWWDNPLVVYADAPFAHADAVGHADAETIVGDGASANVDVRLTLIPHAVVTVQTMPVIDGISGTITVSISSVDDFFDGDWTNMVRIKDRRLAFSFNTCDPARQVEQIMHETRKIPAFSLERYTRDHEKWEPRSHWPAETKTGDSRTVIYGKDAVLDVTGYRYAAR